jgi:hypothetical protein
VLFFLFFVFLISGDLPVKPVDEQQALAVEKVLYDPLMALLVDSLAWHHFGDSPGCCVLLCMHIAR